VILLDYLRIGGQRNEIHVKWICLLVQPWGVEVLQDEELPDRRNHKGRIQQSGQGQPHVISLSAGG